MNHIEQAYKAWRATVKDNPRLLVELTVDTRPWTHPLSPSERARHAVKSYWATLAPEQRSERQRKAAKKMWKRRRAEAR